MVKAHNINFSNFPKFLNSELPRKLGNSQARECQLWPEEPNLLAKKPMHHPVLRLAPCTHSRLESVLEFPKIATQELAFGIQVK